MKTIVIASLIFTAVQLAIPLLFAALGEVITERAGIINVGIEGMVLVGAFAGFTVSYFTHSAILGVLAAISAGSALALISAIFAVYLRSDQVVTGTAINILSLGLTGVFYRTLFHEGGVSAVTFHPISIPFLHRIPVIGEAFFHLDILGYTALLLVPICHLYLFKTISGLMLRSVGEYPVAADANSIPVQRIRLFSFLWGGALAGLSGAYLSISYTNGFVEGMSAGRGFIALAIVILGRWSPVGAFFASLLFGLASALQYYFQATSTMVPYQFFLALPYLLTIAALLLRSRNRFNAPAALGETWQRS